MNRRQMTKEDTTSLFSLDGSFFVILIEIFLWSWSAFSGVFLAGLVQVCKNGTAQEGWEERICGLSSRLGP